MKIILVGIFLAVVCISSYWYFRSNRNTYGMIIILNGPSGSGKSSIQKEFQKLMMPNLWIKLGIDNLFNAPMPDITAENLNYWQSPNPIRWVEKTQDQEGNNVITLFLGDQGEKVAYGMNSAIAEYAKSGCNVIVDYIAYHHTWFDDLKKNCSGIKTYYVAVDIPLDILEQREAARGTSPKGHARSHYFTVYGDYLYDLRVDSSKNSPLHTAQEIKEMIER
jgi:chloramphenicol 3-O-phosphotransferase